MSFASLGYDSCSYEEKLRRTVGPGMYMLSTPNNDVQLCGKDVPADPYMRYQHWGAGTCAPGSAVDDGSELLGLRYKTTTSKCSSDSYIPGKYASKGICNVPGNTNPRACMAPTEDTRLSNPPCTLKGTGWNRWEWLCYDPQEKAIVPFEWNTSYRIVAKDNHVPCIELPLDQQGLMPQPTAQQPSADWQQIVPKGFGAAAPGNAFNAGFTSCASVKNQ
jgi:hypothetical protein